MENKIVTAEQWISKRASEIINANREKSAGKDSYMLFGAPVKSDAFIESPEVKAGVEYASLKISQFQKELKELQKKYDSNERLWIAEHSQQQSTINQLQKEKESLVAGVMRFGAESVAIRELNIKLKSAVEALESIDYKIDNATYLTDDDIKDIIKSTLEQLKEK
jgi:hypothetical protein